MTTIRFTLGDSEVWHEIRLNYTLTGSSFRDEHDLSYIIKREQDRCKNCYAKKVQVIDERGKLLAESSDILEWGYLNYKNFTNHETENS